MVEVVKDNHEEGDISMRQVSPMHTLREPELEDISQSIVGAFGLPPELYTDAPIKPNTVYSIPPPPRNIFYSKEVLENARNLNPHSDMALLDS